MLRRGLAILFASCGLLSLEAIACFEAAADRYRINAHLLVAIAKQESSLNPRAFNKNTNGTVDIGMMQINSRWLPELAKYGIAREHLWDPCMNVMVGAWILARQMAVYGNSWEAVGRYHSGTKGLKENYAWGVWRKLNGRSSNG